ncbi:VWA domain-containing protein [Geodermatophilus sp. SYSU D01186]
MARVAHRRWAQAVALFGAVLVLLGTTSTASAAPAGTGTAALQEFGACLAATGEADVLLLIDQSRSLGRSDPNDVRVPAAQLLLSRLADTAARSGGAIDLAVSGFDSAVRPALGWQPLTTDSVDAASRAIADFADRQDGIDTDYWTALTTARQMLVDHRAPAAARHCQALVLFTDGQFDFSPRVSAADRQEHGTTKPIPGAENIPLTSPEQVKDVIRIGTDELCRAGGVTDALRSDGILLIALGLNAEGNDNLVLLQRIAESKPERCGEQPPYGYFTAATDVTGLVLAFDAVGDPANPPLPVDEKGVCVAKVCSQQAHTFELDSSINSIHLVGTSSAAGIDVYIQPPGADRVKLSYAAAAPTGSVTTGALTIPYKWYGNGAFAIDVQVPASGANWTGPWQVVFVDPTGRNPDAVSKTQLTIQADLFAAIRDPERVEWRVGDTVASTVFDLVRSDGQPAALGKPAPTLRLDVSLRSASGTEESLATDLTPERFRTPGTLTVPEDFPSGPAELRTSLAVTTVSGLDLKPQVRTEQVTVAPAFGFPSLAAEVAFRTATTEEAATATLDVTGPGCVWVESGDQLTLGVHPFGVAPDDLAVTSANGSSEKSCLEVAEGQTGKLELQLSSDTSASGDLAGSLQVHVAPLEDTSRARIVQVPFTAQLERVANTSVFILAFVLALVVGIGIPVLVLLLGRRWAARLPTAALQSALIDVRVGAGGLRLADGSPLTVPDRWDLVPPAQSGRRRTRLSSIPVRAKAGRRLSDAGFAEVDDERRVGVSGAPGGRSPRSLRARLPLALQGSWTLLMTRAHAESADSDVPAQLLIVSDSAATPQKRDDVIARARDEAPAAAESLREAARARRSGEPTVSAAPPAAGSDDPFGLGQPRSNGSAGAAPADPFAAGGPSSFIPPRPRANPVEAPPRPAVDDPFNR